MMERYAKEMADRDAALKAEQKIRRESQTVKPATVPMTEGGPITVNGKSLGRVTAGYEEQHGEAFVGKNPEDVVIGKREDWKNGQ